MDPSLGCRVWVVGSSVKWSCSWSVHRFRESSWAFDLASRCGKTCEDSESPTAWACNDRSGRPETHQPEPLCASSGWLPCPDLSRLGPPFANPGGCASLRDLNQEAERLHVNTTSINAWVSCDVADSDQARCSAFAYLCFCHNSHSKFRDGQLAPRELLVSRSLPPLDTTLFCALVLAEVPLTPCQDRLALERGEPRLDSNKKTVLHGKRTCRKILEDPGTANWEVHGTVPTYWLIWIRF